MKLKLLAYVSDGAAIICSCRSWSSGGPSPTWSGRTVAAAAGQMLRQSHEQLHDCVRYHKVGGESTVRLDRASVLSSVQTCGGQGEGRMRMRKNLAQAYRWLGFYCSFVW